MQLWMAAWDLRAALVVATDLAVEVTVPLRLARSELSFDEDGPMIAGTEAHGGDETRFGLGDVELAVRYAALGGGPRTLDLRLGVSLPTAGGEGHTDSAGAPQRVFFGTGTVDPVLGLNGGWELGAGRLFGWANGRASLYENADGYRAPTRVAAGLGIAGGLGLEQWTFRAGPEINHETAGELNGERDEGNGGRTDLVLGGGVTRHLADWSLDLGLRVPWTIRSAGQEVRFPLFLSLGVGWQIDCW